MTDRGGRASTWSRRIALLVVAATVALEAGHHGWGSDPEATGCGTGLQGMADRLDAVGGTLDVRSAPALGTHVTGSLEAAEVDA
jgi:signal transduction histidine kinase